jgi:hypothetical protein
MTQEGSKIIFATAPGKIIIFIRKKITHEGENYSVKIA